jgi:hypothetical protein
MFETNTRETLLVSGLAMSAKRQIMLARASTAKLFPERSAGTIRVSGCMGVSF